MEGSCGVQQRALGLTYTLLQRRTTCIRLCIDVRPPVALYCTGGYSYHSTMGKS